MKLLVSIQPGVHLRELQRQMGLSFSSTRYHVDKLAKEGEIERFEDGGYSRLYPAGTESSEKILLSLVRRETDHKILSCFLKEPHQSHQSLSSLTGLSKSTISEHLATLLQLGVVKVEMVEERRVFELVDPAQIERMARRYPVLLKKATHRFIDLWDF